MKKKMSQLLLFCMFCILVLQGCSQKQKVLESEPLIFSMLFNETKAAPLKEDWLVLKEYKERKNVMFDIQVADDARYENAITIALETEPSPDIILKVWPQPISEFTNKGFLLPVSDYYDQMPFFKAYIESHDLYNELESLKMKDGKYYLFPGFQRKIQVQQWIYRKDLFEENNLEAPRTYDELFDSLVLLKEKYPFTTPISATWGGAHLFSMIGAGFGIPAGWRGNQFFDAQTNRWVYAPSTENFKEMYIFLNRCYEAGILDPEFFTQTENDFYGKIQDGRVLVTVTWVTSGFNNWNEQLRKHGYPNGEWVPLPVPESPMGIRALPPVGSFRKGVALSAQVKDKPYFKELLQFLDWALYSEEGQTLTYWGVEGVTFKEGGEGKAFLPTIATPKNPTGTVNPKTEYGLEAFFDIVENEEYEDYKKPEGIVAFLNESLLNMETTEAIPPLIIGEDSLKATNMLLQPLNLYVSETCTKFITGELDVETYWEQYLNELTNYGYKTLENIWNSTDN
ncbi:MAG: extracellular solute-binding protein [Sphaerochaeta sp.]|nr:extracellular solute-binding protein [Sphaerochaeta sp.]